MSWLLWFIGVAIWVVVGLTIFNIVPIDFVTTQLANYSNGAAKALFVALGLVAISKFV